MFPANLKTGITKGAVELRRLGQRFRDSCWSTHSLWFLKGNLCCLAVVAATFLPSAGVPRTTAGRSTAVRELALQTATAPPCWWWAAEKRNYLKLGRLLLRFFFFFFSPSPGSDVPFFFSQRSKFWFLLPKGAGRRAVSPWYIPQWEDTGFQLTVDIFSKFTVWVLRPFHSHCCWALDQCQNISQRLIYRAWWQEGLLAAPSSILKRVVPVFLQNLW